MPLENITTAEVRVHELTLLLQKEVVESWMAVVQDRAEARDLCVTRFFDMQTCEHVLLIAGEGAEDCGVPLDGRPDPLQIPLELDEPPVDLLL